MPSTLNLPPPNVKLRVFVSKGVNVNQVQTEMEHCANSVTMVLGYATTSVSAATTKIIHQCSLSWELLWFLFLRLFIFAVN